MLVDLEGFGERLKELRKSAGLSREELADRLGLIHDRINLNPSTVDAQLIYKWEKAYIHRGRSWRPQRYHVICLIQVFADQLTLSEAQAWALQAGHELSQQDLQFIFLPQPDLPPAQAPALPGFFVRRQRLEKIIRLKIEEQQTPILVLWGSGGTGKTTLAIQIGKLLASTFTDGLIWIHCHPSDTVSDIQNSIARSLDFTLNEGTPGEQARRLHSRLRKRKCLLVLDDLPTLPDLVHLRLGSETSPMLVTTRDRKVADLLETSVILVGNLTIKQGLKLLSNWAGYEIKNEELVTRLGGLPLALKLAGAQLRAGALVDELLAAFRQERVNLSILDMDDPQSQAESLTRCFDVSYNRLSQVEQRCFTRLGYFVNHSFSESAVGAVWGFKAEETRAKLKPLIRFALLERTGSTYRLHPLLYDYARQKLTETPTDNRAIRRRHAAWHIRYALYHPGLLGDDPLPAIEQTWPEIVAGIKWAVIHQPQLAAQAALLAHAERPALLEELGTSLIEAVEFYLRQVADQAEQAILNEILGDLCLLQDEIDKGSIYFEQASQLWEKLEDGLAASQARLRMAGANLLQEKVAAAAEVTRQAQALLRRSLPLAPGDEARTDRLFYWFNMVYNPLIRWEELPEVDIVSLVDLADQTNQDVLKARALSIHQLWCTTKAVPRSAEIRQRGRKLAWQAYQLWKSCGRIDRADDEVSFTQYRTKGRYSRWMAARFARRRSQTTPQISPAQINSFKRRNQALYWWLGATEEQRKDWLSWMLPRYLGADNRPYQKARGARLSQLPPNSRVYRWVEEILNIGMLGGASRRVMIEKRPPTPHILNGPEWRVLSGQRAFPLVGNEARRLVQRYLAALGQMLM